MTYAICLSEYLSGLAISMEPISVQGGGGGGGRIVYESQAMGNNWTTAEHYAHCVLYCVGDNF